MLIFFEEKPFKALKKTDIKIIFETVLSVLKTEGIDSEKDERYTMAEFTGKKEKANENSVFSDK